MQKMIETKLKKRTSQKKCFISCRRIKDDNLRFQKKREVFNFLSFFLKSSFLKKLSIFEGTAFFNTKNVKYRILEEI